MTSTSTRITPQDLLEMEDGHRFELVNGEFEERKSGAKSSHIAVTISFDDWKFR